MRTITLPWETWRAVIAVLRESAVLYMLQHAHVIAEQLEEQLEQLAPDEPTVRVVLTDDGLLQSYTWACWQLGIPLPVV